MADCLKVEENESRENTLGTISNKKQHERQEEWKGREKSRNTWLVANAMKEYNEGVV